LSYLSPTKRVPTHFTDEETAFEKLRALSHIMGEPIAGPATVRTKSDLRGSVLTLNPIIYWLLLAPRERTSAKTHGIWKQLGTHICFSSSSELKGRSLELALVKKKKKKRTGFGITGTRRGSIMSQWALASEPPAGRYKHLLPADDVFWFPNHYLTDELFKQPYVGRLGGSVG